MTVTAPAADPQTNERSRRGSRHKAGRQRIGALFIAPYVIFLVAIFAYPVGLAVYMSFHDYFFAAPGAIVERPFIGIDNYLRAFESPAVRQSFGNVAIFLVLNVPLTVVLSLVLATALNAAIPFRTFFRVSYYVPYITASVAVVGVWLFLFSGGGLVNNLLGPLAPQPSWFVNSTLAMPLIAIYVTWKQLGFFVLLYLAALQNVPKELYEAASMDGAGRLRTFMSVTVPGVRSATFLVTLLATITGANLFTEPYLLTGGGGPNGASASPVLVMYQEGIQQGNAGYAAAIGILLIVAVLMLAGIQRLVLGRK